MAAAKKAPASPVEAALVLLKSDAVNVNLQKQYERMRVLEREMSEMAPLLGAFLIPPSEVQFHQALGALRAALDCMARIVSLQLRNEQLKKMDAEAQQEQDG